VPYESKVFDLPFFGGQQGHGYVVVDSQWLKRHEVTQMKQMLIVILFVDNIYKTMSTCIINTNYDKHLLLPRATPLTQFYFLGKVYKRKDLNLFGLPRLSF